MFQSSAASDNFLTEEEAVSVDAALLTSRDKFVTRVAIYSLRVLKQIAQQEQMAIAQISPQQIESWVQQDETLIQNPTPGLETDEGFIQFFSRLVLSSLKPLNQVSAEAGVSLEQVSPDHVIRWFEQQAKERLQQQST
ncbi:MAG: hypothetical protein WBA57_01080 [Elainellaceae cyanobacterium]